MAGGNALKLRLALHCIGLVFALMGCSKPSNEAKGWVNLGVPPAPLGAGWTSVSDAGSGVSMAIPPEWKQLDTLDQNQLADFATLAHNKGHLGVGFSTSGATPDLYAVDESYNGLRQAQFSTVVVLHGHAAETSLDKVETGLRTSTMPDIQRVQLPIGPALRTVRTDPGNTKTVMYMLIQNKESYMFRFNLPASLLDAETPLIDQMMRSVRLVAPDPNAPAKKITPLSPQNQPQQTAEVPTPAPDGQAAAQPQQNTDVQNPDQGSAGPPPGPGVSGESQGTQGESSTGADPNASNSGTGNP